MEKLLSRWNLRCTLTLITDTAWDAGEYILKRYSALSQLQRNVALLTELNAHSVPAAVICPTADGKPYAEEDGQYFLLTKKLKGESRDFTVKDHMPGKIGEAIGKLHLAFSKMELSDLRENSLLAELEGWIFDALQKEHWRLLSEESCRETAEKLRVFWPELPISPIHRDVHPGNFLFDGGELSGYLDFDLSQRNIRIFDLCYYLCGLLTGEEKVSSEDWLAAVKEAVEGYTAVLPLKKAEYQAMPAVMQAIEVLFAAYFLSTGDSDLAVSAKELFDFLCIQEESLHLLF